MIAIAVQLLLIVSAVRTWKVGHTNENKKLGLIAPAVFAVHWPIVYLLARTGNVAVGGALSLLWMIICIIIAAMVYRKVKKEAA